MTMKRILYAVLAAVALTSLTSCGNIAERRVRSAAEGFLNAFCSMDYEAASALCTERFADMLLEGTLDMDEIPESIMDKMKEACEETSFRIVSLSIGEELSPSVVDFLIKAPGLEKEVPGRLILIFEGRTALVDAVE